VVDKAKEIVAGGLQCGEVKSEKAETRKVSYATVLKAPSPLKKQGRPSEVAAGGGVWL
jgi:hypothetical protein